MSALLLTAVVGTLGQTSVALAANHLLAVVLLGESGKSRLDDSSSQLEQHLHGGVLSDVVVADGLRVLQLLSLRFVCSGIPIRDPSSSPLWRRPLLTTNAPLFHRLFVTHT